MMLIKSTILGALVGCALLLSACSTENIARASQGQEAAAPPAGATVIPPRPAAPAELRSVDGLPSPLRAPSATTTLTPATTATAIPPQANAAVTPSVPAPAVIATATTSPTSTAEPLPGIVTASDVSFRAGPSKLFPILKTLRYGQKIEVSGATPGREWFQVRTGDGQSGWMKASYVHLDLATEAIPIRSPDSSWITLKGAVNDSSGKPVVGAYVVLFDGKNHGSEAKSWEDGFFYIFIPKEKQGRWNLALVGLDCANTYTNPICRQAWRFRDNPRMVDLTGDMTIAFLAQTTR